MSSKSRQWFNHEINEMDFNPMMECISEFHEKFGLSYLGPPRYLNLDISDFRIKFMQEELEEYKSARSNMSLEGQLDALVDLAYVLLGTAYLHGFDFQEAWNRVHRANMNKVRASHESESTRNNINDVVKPEDWVPPYLKDLM